MKTKILLLLFIAIAGVSTLVTPKARAMSAAAAKELNGIKEYYLGSKYYYGKGVPQNYAKADYWFKKSAVQGNAFAEDYLGVAYAQGRGVSLSDTKAIYWYKKAAEQGNADAEKNLIILEK